MKSKLQVKKGIEKEIDEYYNNKVEITKRKCNVYKQHDWDYWHSCHEIAEAKLSQLKEDVKEELYFLEKLSKILNKYHSEIHLVEIGRQNVLNNVDNELKLDDRIKELKEVLK